MIRASLQCADDGQFRALAVAGHALFAKRGSDIVCASVSVLARTCSDFLQAKRIDFECVAPERGCFVARVNSAKKGEEASLRNLADFLKVGLDGIQKDFPAFFSFETQP